MFGAFKCCGVGARVLRNGVSASSSLDPLTVGGMNASLLCSGNLNWSQRRFVRGNGCSPGGPRNFNAQFIIKEIEGLLKQVTSNDQEDWSIDLESLENPNLRIEKELRKYSRSLRGHQSLLLASLPNMKENVEQENLLATISKIIIEDAPANVRVKSRKDDTLLREWIGVQKELRAVRRERLVDYKRKLQIAGEKALQEMEANLKKGMNLDDLDQAIEGALCSQAKAEYSQQKSSHDN